MSRIDTGAVSPPAAVRRGRRTASFIQGLAIALGLVMLFGGFGVLAVNYQPYRVPTASMSPTVRVGDTVLARRVSGGSVGRGDVVVFRAQQWGAALMVKRVVAMGGDTVTCCDAQQRLTVNGTPIDEPYTEEGRRAGPATAFTADVPAGRLFLLGDFRANSLDSRSHLDVADGTMPVTDVVGRVEGTVWPDSRVGLLGRTVAFDAVSGPRSSQPGPLEPAVLATATGAALIVVVSLLGWFGSLAGWLRRRWS